MSNKSPNRRFKWRQFTSAIRAETSEFQLRLQLFNAVADLLPWRSASTAGAQLLALLGCHVGRGVRLGGTPKITGGGGSFGRLSIGDNSVVDAGCVFDLEEQITVGKEVTLGPGVMILTSTHELASSAHRAGPVTRAPVTIGDGALLQARVIVLPGVTIGAGAIVEAGAVINKDVAANVRVGGIPGTQLEELSDQ